MKFINKNLKKINKSLNLKKINKSLNFKKINKFFKKHYILILVLFLMIYLMKTSFREYFGGMGKSSVNECEPKALPVMTFCGNEKDSPKTQATNFIKNLKMQVKYYLKVIKNNKSKSDKVFESSITVALSKSEKLNEKWNNKTKKPSDLKNWIIEDNGRKEEIGKYIVNKYENDNDFKKNIKDLGEKFELLAKKYGKFNEEIGEKKSNLISYILINFFLLGPNIWKTIFEANGMDEDGFLYKDKYKENSFIFIKEIIKGLHEIHDDVIIKHSIYKKYKIDDKKK